MARGTLWRCRMKRVIVGDCRLSKVFYDKSRRRPSAAARSSLRFQLSEQPKLKIKESEAQGKQGVGKKRNEAQSK